MSVKVGDRVECVSMNDPYDPIPAGTRGTVTDVSEVNFGAGDRFTQVCVNWDNGRTLMPVIPPDVIRVVS